MCIAIPAKIIETDAARQTAKASLAGNVMDVNVRLVSAQVGDYVLVHVGCAVEVLQKESAEEILSLFDELRAVQSDT